MGLNVELIDPDDAHDFMASFNAATRRAGEAYFRQGRVSNLRCVEPGARYAAQVQGSQLYEVNLHYDPIDGWDGDCSCAIGFDCKHVCAVTKALLAEASLAQVQALSAGATRTGSAAPSVRRMSDGPRSNFSFTEKVKDALNRPLRKNETAFLEQLERVYAHCCRTRNITRWDLADLGFHLGGLSWEAIQIWPAFPEDLHQFWLYIANVAQQHHQPIPEFLQPVTDLAEIQERMQRWERQREIERWKIALAHVQESPVAAQSQLGEVEIRLRLTARLVVLECKRPGQETFEPLNVKQSRRLYEDCQYGRILLSAPADLLWQFLHQRIMFGRPVEFSYEDSEGTRTLGRLLRYRQLEHHVVAETGLPFVRATDPLHWSLSMESPGDAYCLRLTQADGTKLPPLLFTVDGNPPLYVTRDTIYAGPPTRLATLDPAKDNRIPAPALETVAGVRFLEQLHIELPSRIQQRLRRVPMQVSIRCELAVPYADARSEYCVVQVQAVSEDGQQHEIWDNFSWVSQRPGTPIRDNGGDNSPLVFYDRSALARVPFLLEPLELKMDSLLRGLAVRVTRKFPDIFTAWLRTIPPEIKLDLVGELNSFSAAELSGRVRLEVSEADIDWFDLRVVLDVSDTELTPEELRLLLNAKGAYVRLEKKGWRRLAFDLSEEDDERLARLGLNPHELTSEPQRLHALQLADEAARKFLPAEQAEEVHRRAGEIKARVTPPLPAGLTAELRPYQVEGFHFLAYLAANHFGGILADDMGLGKTVQALAWLLWLRAQPEAAARPSLVVCPKSVMDNWQAEAQRFAPSLRVKVCVPSELDQFLEHLPEADLHVLNYSQLRILGENLVPVQWLALILDEGQYIKNPNSQTAQVARALHATYRLVLSGTPIENRLLDLWSLMAFTMPGVLGSRHSFAKLFDAKTDPLARRRLSARVRPFLLRRTKSQVAKDLPDKVEEDLFCEIEGEQKSLYRAELKHAQQLLLRIKTQKELAKEQFNFLTSLLRLRQICCHPALVKPDSKAESAKATALFEQLEPLMDEGQKVLVFSQFVELLELLKPGVEERGWPCFYLTGATENRGELVQQFQSTQGEAVFLISLKAGGFGLNLTAASYVVLFDPWWNPAVETQAIDRTHRIGQVNKVMAYRLLIKDSVEEKIRALQRQKSQLAEDVLGEEKFAQSLTLDDLKYLLAD